MLFPCSVLDFFGSGQRKKGDQVDRCWLYMSRSQMKNSSALRQAKAAAAATTIKGWDQQEHYSSCLLVSLLKQIPNRGQEGTGRELQKG